MEGKPIDFDRGDLNTGTTIRIFTNFDNIWKTAVIQEIDLTERELLVDFSDGTQEWISFDGRKICYPPNESHEMSSEVEFAKRRSTSKFDKNEPIAKKTKGNRPEAIEKTSSSSNSSRKKSLSMINSKKPSEMSKFSKKQVSSNQSKMSKEQSKSSLPLAKSSAFLRLKFKCNEKPIKGSGKVESRRRKRFHPEDFNEEESSEETSTFENSEQNDEIETTSNKSLSKNNQTKSKESKKEKDKLKIKLSNRSGDDNSSVDTSMRRKSNTRDNCSESTISKEKTEPFLFTAAQEKKIKTLLPKRNTADNGGKSIVSSTMTSAEMPFSCLSLSKIYTTETLTPTLNLCSSSSRYICPKQDCKKQFRNENLLMMHIKHYHREYRNMLSSMPNVADLAYARTVGEHIESPQRSFLEKIAKLEEDRLKDKDSLSTPESKIQECIADEKCSGERVHEQSTKQTKSASKKIHSGKRFSALEPSSLKVSILVAQLQEPPLVPPPFSIQSDVELSVSQNRTASMSSPQYSDYSNSVIDSDEKQEGPKRSLTKKRRLSQLESTDVINCLCGYGFEDGLMVQCDLCQCWQHGACVGYENETDVPLNYTCETCQFPKRCHRSRKYLYVQNWLKEGIMPNFRFSNPNEEVCKNRSEFLKSTHQLLCDLTELRHAVRNLQVKIQILRQTPNHPKLYLWAKSWNNRMNEEKESQSSSDVGPIPEDAINMDDCRKHLSEHIDEEIYKADAILRHIEIKIENMEEIDAGDETDDEDTFCKNPEKYVSVAKQTLLMMLRDLTKIQYFKYCDR